MKIYNADKTPLNIIRILTAIITILLLIICRMFITLYIIMIILMCVFSAAGIILIFFWFPAMFRNMEFYINENTITKKHGVFFHSEQTIQISSIQYMTTATCFLEGFCFIVLNIYGGIMILPFLSRKNFKAIRNDIEYYIRK